ncbi:MAG: helix-turn-helix transcriptional regulator [Bacteroidia bacterium]
MKHVRYYFNDQYLTAKEAQVVSLLRRCYTPKQIAYMYNNSNETINTIIKNIDNKLNIHHRSELLVWAMENGFDKEGNLKGTDIFEGVQLLPLPAGAKPGDE